MVVVVGRLAGIAVLDLAWRGAEAIANRLAAPVLMCRALDLERRGDGAPQKIIGHIRDHGYHMRIVSFHQVHGYPLIKSVATRT